MLNKWGGELEKKKINEWIYLFIHALNKSIDCCKFYLMHDAWMYKACIHALLYNLYFYVAFIWILFLFVSYFLRFYIYKINISNAFETCDYAWHFANKYK